MNTTFGERLQQLRTKRGLSRRDLALRCRLSAAYLEKVERGYSAPPSAPTISDLSKAVRADGDELFVLSGKLAPDLTRSLLASPLLVLAVRALAQWSTQDLRQFLVTEGVPVEQLNWTGIDPSSLKNDERRVQREVVSADLKRAVFYLDNHECVYCSSTTLLEVDHLQPITLGGTNEIENLVTCCVRCNKKKGNRAVPFVRVFGRFREEVKNV